MTRILAVGFGCLAVLASAWLASSAQAQADPCPNAALRSGPSAGLPDCRAFELVSPAYKLGGTGVGSWYDGFLPHGEAGYAAYDGERFAVRGVGGSVLIDSAFGFADDTALAERSAAGWVSRPAATRGGYGIQWYRFAELAQANGDMSRTLWDSNGGVLRLFPEMESWSAGNEAGNPLFVRDWADGRWDLFGPTDPAVQRDWTQEGLNRYALSADGAYAVASGPIRGLAGAGDPSHPSWPAGDFAPRSHNAYLFDISGGLTDAFPVAGDRRRSLVNACSAGTLIPARLAGGELAEQGCAPPGDRDATLISSRGGRIGDPLDQAISRDGSRVFFMSPNPNASDPDGFSNPAQVGGLGAGAGVGHCGTATGAATSCPAQVFVRQRNADGSVATRWVSRSRSEADGDGGYGGAPIAGQDASLLGPAIFEGASRDGSRVFFRTTSPLTPDDPNAGAATASRDSWDLYMYELPPGPDGDRATPDADPGDGTLTRISAGPTGASDCESGFQGHNDFSQVSAARFVSDDGGRVYFVCDKPLVDGPGATNGTITAPGPSPAIPGPGFEVHTAANLYLYDAASQPAQRWRFVAQIPRVVGTALDACASTATDQGLALRGGTGDDTDVTARRCLHGTADGAFLAFMTSGRLTDDDAGGTVDIYAYDAEADELTRVTRPDAGAVGGTYACGPEQCHGDTGIGGGAEDPLPPLNVVADPDVAGDRVAFFQSRSRLVAEDVDDAYDVYQWRNGELSLLSAGVSGEDGALYRGNDRSGRNVFMSTRDRLSWQDSDAVLDVYTVRVGGGIPQPPEPVPCDLLAGACQEGGGAGLLAASPVTGAAGGANVVRRPRARLALRGPTLRQRRRAARRGVVALRVRVSRPGRVVAVVRARLGRRARPVGRASRRLSGPGAATLRVRLNRAARRHLRTGRRLRLTARAKTPGALARTTTFTLRRPRR